ncbi:hypothetical protein AB0764_11365 [Priestia megaterium]|uniref:alanine:cation symporter family protein n=2 Tax=Bacillaceae TaxID=186817 RepID=UPI00112A455F|nr:alanine:cation symporter family protein [Priestia megaterium]QDZ80309.1 hypothetical protein D0440_12980 [Priestia megaterium]TPF19187.1 hypothetical protein CBE78_08180 [Priestia megaterium]TPF23297.1 hypothetical protein CBE79_10690 [Priestia megaterium]
MKGKQNKIVSMVLKAALLAKPALITLKDYREQRKQGIDPVFSPGKLGIQNADYWDEEYQHNQDKENVS